MINRGKSGPDFLNLRVLCVVVSFLAFMNVIINCGFKAKDLLYFPSCFQSSHKYKHTGQKSYSF